MIKRLLVIFVSLAALSLAACGGGGGGGRAIPYNPPDSNGQNGPSYNRIGSAYMSTVSGNTLTYEVARSTSWEGISGIGSVWHDTDDTTYVRDTADIDGVSHLIMKAEPAREQNLWTPSPRLVSSAILWFLYAMVLSRH